MPELQCATLKLVLSDVFEAVEDRQSTWSTSRSVLSVSRPSRRTEADCADALSSSLARYALPGSTTTPSWHNTVARLRDRLHLDRAMTSLSVSAASICFVPVEIKKGVAFGA